MKNAINSPRSTGEAVAPRVTRKDAEHVASLVRIALRNEPVREVVVDPRTIWKLRIGIIKSAASTGFIYPATRTVSDGEGPGWKTRAASRIVVIVENVLKSQRSKP